MDYNKNPTYLYCAGLYEGEGSICCTYNKDPRNGNRNKIPVRKLVLKISMTDREPLELFEDIMQVGNLSNVGVLPSGKRLYEYRVGKFEEVKFVIDAMYEWLSPRRKKQADDAINKYLEKGLPRGRK
jgi:hypothetical protein